jgi:membrane associated rhomboid family serine protease
MAGSTSIGRAVQLSLAAVTGLFALETADYLFPFSFDAYGIVPRTLVGLRGICFSPLLHANFAHLLTNAVPLFVLLMVLFSHARYRPGLTLAMIWIGSGVGTWLIGRGNAIHIGASSIIYGLVAYLIVAGIFMKSWVAAAVAIAVGFVYGGVLYGIFAQPAHVSWEGHLSGALAGVWAAWKNHR